MERITLTSASRAGSDNRTSFQVPCRLLLIVTTDLTLNLLSYLCPNHGMLSDLPAPLVHRSIPTTGLRLFNATDPLTACGLEASPLFSSKLYLSARGSPYILSPVRPKYPQSAFETVRLKTILPLIFPRSPRVAERTLESNSNFEPLTFPPPSLIYAFFLGLNSLRVGTLLFMDTIHNGLRLPLINRAAQWLTLSPISVLNHCGADGERGAPILAASTLGVTIKLFKMKFSLSLIVSMSLSACLPASLSLSLSHTHTHTHTHTHSQ